MDRDFGSLRAAMSRAKIPRIIRREQFSPSYNGLGDQDFGAAPGGGSSLDFRYVGTSMQPQSNQQSSVRRMNHSSMSGRA